MTDDAMRSAAMDSRDDPLAKYRARMAEAQEQVERAEEEARATAAKPVPDTAGGRGSRLGTVAVLAAVVLVGPAVIGHQPGLRLRGKLPVHRALGRRKRRRPAGQ
jgi:hypothetical protein